MTQLTIKSHSGIKQSDSEKSVASRHKTALKDKEANGSNPLSKPTPILTIKQKLKGNIVMTADNNGYTKFA